MMVINKGLIIISTHADQVIDEDTGHHTNTSTQWHPATIANCAVNCIVENKAYGSLLLWSISNLLANDNPVLKTLDSVAW